MTELLFAAGVAACVGGWVWLAEAALYNPDRTLKRVMGWLFVAATVTAVVVVAIMLGSR